MINPFRRKSIRQKTTPKEKCEIKDGNAYSLESLEPRLLLAADLGIGLDFKSEWDHDTRQLATVSSVFEEAISATGFTDIGHALISPDESSGGQVDAVFAISPISDQAIVNHTIIDFDVDDQISDFQQESLIAGDTITLFSGSNAAPVLTTIGDQSVDELTVLSFTVTATDSDIPADTLIYSLDAASLALGMTIDANTGAFSWSPTELQGGVNPSVTITVSDSGAGNLFDSETFSIAVNDINLIPSIISDGAGTTADINIVENKTAVTTVVASDADVGDVLTYSIIGGADSAQFAIDESTGELTFIAQPDFESATDNNSDNSYKVIVQAQDEKGATDTQVLTVNVSNISPVVISVSGGDGAIVNNSYTLNLSADEDVISWIINWGDGAIETVSGTVSSVTHIYTQEGLTHDISVSATDADGTWQQNELFIADYDNSSIARYDPVTGTIINTFGPVNQANHIIMGPDGLLYVSSFADGTILRFIPDTGAFIDTFVSSVNGPTSFSFGPDGDLYVASKDDNGVFRFDGETGALIGEFVSITRPQGIAFGQDGYLYVSGYYQGINRYDSETGTYIDSFVPGLPSLNDLSEIVFGPDGNLYAIDVGSSAIVSYDHDTGAALGEFVSAGDGGLSGATGLKFGPDGNLYVSSEFTGQVLRYNGTTGAFIDVYATADKPVGLVFLPQHQVEVLSPNVAPVLAPVVNQIVSEGFELTFTATASDLDVPADTLTFTLDATSLALGMSIDANSGQFSWTPTETQGPSAHSVTITVTDSGSNNLNDSETFTITVNESNTAPILSAIGNQSINEGVELTFTAATTDVDLPANSLIYSLDAASIALGMTIDANTGAFSWTPTEGQGGLTPSVTITVTDSGTGNLFDSETLIITVNDDNTAPSLSVIGNQSSDEGVALSFTATATDTDQPSDSLTFSLDSASLALGMTIDANTGVFSWTPMEGQGGLTPSVTITVTDSGTGNLFDSETLSITVNDINSAPVLTTIGNQSSDEGVALSFTATATDTDQPTDTLTYSLDTASLALGMTIDANTGAFSWTPTEGQGGLTPSVTITVTDSGTGNLFDSETLTITVNDINSAPILAVIGDQNTDEGVTLSFTATATDTDHPSDSLTFSLDAASVALGMTIDANTGAFSWTPTEGQGGLTPSVTITVTDSGTGNLFDSETLTITVNDINSAPILAAVGNQSIDEGATLSFTATATDTDQPTDTLTYSLDTASLALGMTIDANTGVFSWTPMEGQGGLTPSVTITVTDSGTGNLFDSETLSITVNDINSAPVLTTIGNQSSDEGVALSFTATATDTDQPTDTLTYSLDAASLALGMTIDANTGVFSWTPTEGQGGLTSSVAITVTDSGTGNLFDSETLIITVNDDNTAPILAVIGDQNTDEGVTLSFTATATDTDHPSDSLTFSLDAASVALGMTIDANTGVFSWTPMEGQGGLIPSVTITVIDSGTGNLFDSETLSITVNDVNSAPSLAAIGGQSIDEGATLSFTAIATDTDHPSDTFTYSLDAASLALGMTIDANTGVFSWTPTEGQGGLTPSVTITVTDSGTGNLFDSETLIITVNDDNTAPILAVIGDQNTVEGVTLSFTATATDTDHPSDTFTYSLDAASVALGMTIDANTGAFSWTPTEGQGGLTPSVTITVTDSGTGNLFDSETLIITVNDDNTAPILAVIGDQNTDEGVTLSFTAAATDTDQPTDTLTYSLDAASLALGMTIDANTGVFSWTPTEGQGGLTPSVTITVTDSGTGNLFDSETLIITVNDDNTAPILAVIGDQNTVEGVTLSFTATATDTDHPSDTFTYSLDAASVALGMTIDANTGAFSWTPTEGQGGLTPSVTITVTDSGTGNLFDSETLIITVNDDNTAPILAVIGDQNTDEGVTLSFTAAATDTDQPTDTLTYSLDAASLALGMTIDANTGVFSWTPTEGQGGLTPSVTITVTDSGTGNLFDSETLIITVNDDNTAPILAVIGDQNTVEGVTLSFTATATDTDHPSDTFTYSLDAASVALGMTIDANTGAFSWTPTEGQGGLTPSVTITVTDSGTGNLFDSETLIITVNDDNTAPILAVIGDQNTDEGVTLSFTAAATDTDQPTDTLTYSLDAASLALGMTIDANTGIFSWTPTEGQGGLTPSVTITVTDSGTGNLIDSETLSITVNDVNSAPVLTTIGNQSSDEGVALSFTATATDTDHPSDSLTFSLDAASVALGMTIDANTGVFSWTPPEGQGGLTPSVTITVTDSGTGNLVDSETLIITVNDVNTAPILATIGNQSIDEGATLSFTATAVDSDHPSDSVTFSLDAASLALGMTIDENTGVFSWTPTESQGGLTSPVTITVTDSGAGNSIDSETLSITVNHLDSIPVLVPIGDQSIDEGTTLSFTATATDSDLPFDSLTFSLDAESLALGMTIEAHSGIFSWTPTESQGGLLASVTIAVNDSSNLTDSVQFSIAVNNVNEAPVIVSSGGGDNASMDITENQTTVVNIDAFDPDSPHDDLSYSIVGGADQDLFQLNESGELTFIIEPDYASMVDENGDGIYEVEVQVSDGQSRDIQLIRIIVLEDNELPIAAAVLNGELPALIEEPTDPNTSSTQNPTLPNPIAQSPAVTDNKEETSSEEASVSSATQTEMNIQGIDAPPVFVAKTQNIGYQFEHIVDDNAIQRFLRKDLQGSSFSNELVLNSLSITREAIRQLANDADFRESLDDLKKAITEDSTQLEAAIQSSALFATGLSIGYIAWLAKGGLMASSLVSSMPMWRVLDPIPVLSSMEESDGADGDEDQSLASMIENDNALKQANRPIESIGKEVANGPGSVSL